MDKLIEICVDYGRETFTLATVRIGEDDIVVYFDSGHLHELRSGKKWDPHATYHGESGVSHEVSYGAHYEERIKQPLNSNFSGWENVRVQGFAPDAAQKIGRRCEASREHIVVRRDQLKEKYDLITDRFGDVRTQMPTASFQIDLIEPNRADLIPAVTPERSRVIVQKLIDDTSPWLLISVLA